MTTEHFDEAGTLVGWYGTSVNAKGNEVQVFIPCERKPRIRDGIRYASAARLERLSA